MALFPVVERTIAAPKEASREDILLPRDVNPDRLLQPMQPRENVSPPCAAMASSRRLADLAKITHGASTCASGEASFGCVRVGRDNMNRHLLFLVFLIALVAVASPPAGAQRGLTIDPPPSSRAGPTDRPSPGSNTVVAQGTNPDPGEIFKDCNDCPEVVVVPTGDFVMGANDTPYEKPERKITIPRPFAIGRREVTFTEWDLCADAGACKHRPDDHGWGRGDRPVINVGWEDAGSIWPGCRRRPGKGTGFRLKPSGNMRRVREPNRRSGGAGTSAPAGPSATAAAARPTGRPLQRGRSGPTASDCTTRPEMPPNGSRIAGTTAIATLPRTHRPGPAAIATCACCAVATSPASRPTSAPRRGSAAT